LYPLSSEDIHIVTVGSEWRTNPHPDVLLQQIHPELRVHHPLYGIRTLPWPLQRGLQLFGCACARSVWDLLTTEAQNAIRTRERFLYHQASEADLQAAALGLPAIETTAYQHAHASAAHAAGYYHRADAARDMPPLCHPLEAARSAAKALACRKVGPAPIHPPSRTQWHREWSHVYTTARARQADWVRDIFPPPGTSISDLRVEPEWRTATVQMLTHHADTTGDYSVLPILADALHEAGCDNPLLLRHCREQPHHVRGCWVVEQLLGRFEWSDPEAAPPSPREELFDFVPPPHDDGTRHA
jgi:hypothetical protein